jgi:hypothetical protein
MYHGVHYCIDWRHGLVAILRNISRKGLSFPISDD